MSEIGFYHLTRGTVEEALARLLGRTIDAHERAVVRCRNAPHVKAVDSSLWKVRDPVWLPHGSAATGHGPRQPVWLTDTYDVPNGARFLFLLDGASNTGLEAFARVFDLFNGADEQAVARARKRWVAARSAGHDLAYWQQQPRGWHRAR